MGLSLILLSLSIGKGQEWSPGEKLLVQITAPFQRFFMGTVHTTRTVWRNYFSLVQVRQENASLKKELSRLEIENSKYQELLLENQRLQKLLNFQKSTDEPLLPARVIGWDSSGLFRSILIDKGEDDGLTVNMPVVSSEGVVGRVVSVSSHYAQVLLITDQNSAVDGLLQRSRARGTLKGRGTGDCFFDYVIKTSDVAVGDAIVTSGMGGMFPKGLLLGMVSEIRESPHEFFKQVQVEPAVDLSKVEEVLVVLRSGFVPSAKAAVG
jgi:rod shape-determining protein MreC